MKISLTGTSLLLITLASGQRKRQSTRPGAVWLITDVSDEPIGYFPVGDRPARAVIPKKR